MILLKFKLTDPKAKLPVYAEAGSSGMDIYSIEKKILRPQDTVRVKTGVAADIPEGYELQVRPRSGLASKGIVAEFGTIDQSFHHPMEIIMTNTGTETYMVEEGDRIAQLILAKVDRCTPHAVGVDEYFPDAVRGRYGSTGR